MPKQLQPFMLSGRVLALAANTETEIQINTGGFDTWIFGIVSEQTGTYSMNFTPSDTQKQYASDVVPNTMIAGTAQDPFRLDRQGAGSRPLFVRRNSTISVTVLDTSGAPNTIDIAFVSFRR